MKTIFSYSLTKAFVAVGLLCGMFSLQCKNPRFLHIESESGSSIINKKIGGVEIAMELSTNSLIDNKLAIINKSKRKVIIRPDDISIEFPGASLRATAVRDYNAFLSFRAKQMESLCSKSSQPYSCADQMRTFYNQFKNLGFSFDDTILPRHTSVGYIAFNIPLLVNNTKWDNDSIVNKITGSASARIKVAFVVNHKKRIVTFPLRVSLYELDSLPYFVARNLK